MGCRNILLDTERKWKTPEKLWKKTWITILTQISWKKSHGNASLESLNAQPQTPSINKKSWNPRLHEIQNHDQLGFDLFIVHSTRVQRARFNSLCDIGQTLRSLIKQQPALPRLYNIAGLLTYAVHFDESTRIVIDCIEI